MLDVSNELSASERAALEVISNDVYAESKGRLFFLIVNIKGAQPSVGALAQALQTQVRTLSNLPLGIVTLDKASGQLLLLVPASVTASPYEQRVVHTQQDWLAGLVENSRGHGLAEAGKYVSGLLAHGVPPRPTSEVLIGGYEEHAATVWGTGAFGLFGGLFGFRRWNRRRARTCEHCHQPRELLSEAADDAHLSAGQRTEESVRSVDYDVWWCGRCNDALVLDYSAWLSGFGNCPGCSNRTKSSNSTTLQHATEYSGGLVQVDERCAHCSYKNTYTRTTARITRSTSTSSSSSSSFGGGSSSGGGSSGSW